MQFVLIVTSMALHCPHKVVSVAPDPISEPALDSEVLSNDDHPSDHEYIPSDQESIASDDDDNESMSDAPDATPVDPNDDDDNDMLDVSDAPDAAPDNLNVPDATSVDAPDATADDVPASIATSSAPDVAPPPSPFTSLSRVSPSVCSSPCFLRPAEKLSYSQALSSPPVSSPELFSPSHPLVPTTPPGHRPALLSPAAFPPVSRQPTRPAKMAPRKRRSDTDVSGIAPKSAPT